MSRPLTSDVKPVAWERWEMCGEYDHFMDIRCDGDYVKYDDAATTVTALQSEIEALRKDAERWRFICQDAYETVVPHGVKIDGSRTAWIPHLLVGNNYEAAVDAAIEKEKHVSPKPIS